MLRCVQYVFVVAGMLEGDATWHLQGLNKGRTVAPTTFILPDLPWAVLLGPIMHDARPGDALIVHTDAMREHVEQAIRTAGPCRPHRAPA